MAKRHMLNCVPLGRDCLPLDAARTAFEWLVTGPDPLSVEGRRFPGLPRRRVPLDELRELLLDPALPMSTVDPVWVRLVTRSRDEGGAATVGCVGVALPALFAIAAELCGPFADEHHDIHAAVLTGFLSELARADLDRPWVMWRLRCAALRAGHLFIRDALESPIPSEEDFHSGEPARPWGHEDFVLARAAAWLAEQAPYDDPGDRRERDVEIRAVNAVTITAAVRESTSPSTTTLRQSRTVTARGGRSAKEVRRSVLKNAPESGVEGCGRRAVAPAHTTSPDRPTGTTRTSSTTPEEPRCA